MSRFVDEAIARAGLAPVVAARRGGDIETVRRTMPEWQDADLLVLGAVADAARVEDVGVEVRVHETSADADVIWIEGATELDVLRGIAVARIARGGRIGVDWSRYGLELAQVALGFGASDLRGPITKKSGLPILATEAKKVKGEGMVDLAALKRREISALVRHAGRVAVFVDDRKRHVPAPPPEESHPHV